MIVVADAGPLIYLAAIGQFELPAIARAPAERNHIDRRGSEPRIDLGVLGVLAVQFVLGPPHAEIGPQPEEQRCCRRPTSIRHIVAD